MSLRELYQEIILDHGKQPRNFRALEHPTHAHAGHNPLCGDKLRLYVVADNDVVSHCCFEGTGCAISMASASLMTEAVQGKSLTQINQLFEDFHRLVTTGEESEAVGKLAALSGVAEFPIRVKCATLAWHTLKAALNNDPNKVSTESS